MEIAMSLDEIFWIVAGILFGLRAFGVATARVHLGWLGLVFVALAFIF